MPAGYPRPYTRQLTAEDFRKRSIKVKLENEFEASRGKATKKSNFPFRRVKNKANQVAESRSGQTFAPHLLISKLLDFIEIYREVHADMRQHNSENNRHLAHMGAWALSKWISNGESTLTRNLSAISTDRFEDVSNEEALVIALRYAAQIVYMQDSESDLQPQPKVVDLLIFKLTNPADCAGKTTSPTMLKAFEDLIFVLSDHVNGRDAIAELTFEMHTNINRAASGRENISDSPVGLTID
jgi:hypothetical protein